MDSLWDMVPWALSGGSLFWNWLNSKRTSKIQKQNRGLDHALEEFRRLRNSIDVALDELRQEVELLRGLSFSAQPIVDLQTEVRKRQESINIVYAKLTSALERTDRSPYANGNDWCDCTSQHWDEFLQEVDRAYHAGPEAAAREAPTLAAAKLKLIASSVDDKLNEEVQRLAN